MGMPDPTKVWNSDELSVAIDILSQLKWSQPYSLPRKDSHKSSVLFDRLISLDNMIFIGNDTLKHYEKAYFSMQFLQIFEKWNDVYTHPMWKKQYYHRELVDININEMRVAEIMVGLTKYIMASRDPYDVALKSGVPQVKADCVSSMINLLNLQSHTSQFMQEDLEMLTDSLSASILRNKDWMDSSSIHQLKKSIDVVLDSTSSDYVKSKYHSVQDQL